METINTTQQPKRPTGMTILLVLSFINALWNILRSFVMFVMTPQLGKIYDSGQFEEMLEPFSSLGEDFVNSMTDNMTLLSQISPYYYLILLVLFIASLIGVIKMFKNDKRGFHIYSIAQICMLIDHSVFFYPLQKPSPFTYDLLTTILFIFAYYLYFKRMQLTQTTQNQD